MVGEKGCGARNGGLAKAIAKLAICTALHLRKASWRKELDRACHRGGLKGVRSTFRSRKSSWR